MSVLPVATEDISVSALSNDLKKELDFGELTWMVDRFRDPKAREPRLIF